MTFHQKPAVICQDAVIRQEQCHFAARLRETPETQQLRELICAFIYHVYVQSNTFMYMCLLCGCLCVCVPDESCSGSTPVSNAAQHL